MYVFRGHVPVLAIVFMSMAAALWTPLSVADQRTPLTIAEAEDLALGAEPGQVALLARAEAMQAQAVAAGQLPDPTLRLGLGNYPIDGGGFSTEGMTQAQLGLRQAFPRARAAEAERFDAEADAFAWSAQARARDVLTATREAWLNAYYAQQSHALVTESRPLFADLVTITRSLYSVGRKSQHDVLRAELELSRLDDRLIEIDRARAEAKAELSRWLGQDAYRPVAAKLPNWQSVPPLEDLHASLESHPKLAAADAGVLAGQAAVRAAQERKKPGWALDVGYGYREGFLPNGEPRSDFVSVAVTVDLPFFAKNRQDRRLAAALGERRAAQSAKAEMRLRLVSEMDAQFARWTDLTRRLALYESQILEQSRGRAQAALLAYQSDAGDFADVMRASIDDLNIRIEHLRLRVERAQSYAVLANLGGFSR